MKFFIFLFMIFFITSFQTQANRISYIDSIPANNEDVRSVDGVISALYDVISGHAGEKRNWDRMRTLFLAGARMIATGKKLDGSYNQRIMTVEDYIVISGPLLEKNGFFEKEISRKTEQFGTIAHLFSTYESRHLASDEKPFMRGINSIQLFNDGKRWWIVNILWQPENPDHPIPEKYLTQ